jgi:hypothetical protein
MPTVPVYDTPVVDMAAGSMPVFQAPGVEPMRDVAGRQISESGQMLMKSGLAIKKLADEINFDLAEAGAKQDTNKLSDKIRNIVVEYNKLTGKEAVESRDKYAKQIEDAIVGITDEVKNTDQPKGYTALRQQLFANAANTRRQVAIGQLDSHYLPQLKNWQIGEAKSAIHNSINDTAVAAGDWKVPTGNYAKFKGTLIVNVDDLAFKSGITKIDDKGNKVVDTDSQQYKELMRTSLTALHSDVIKNFVSKDQDGLAAEYLKAFKGEIAADKLDELTKMVEVGSSKDTSLKLAMSMTGTLNEQLALLESKYKKGEITSTVYDMTRQRVEHNWNVQQQGRAQWEKGLIGSAQDWLLKNPEKGITDMPTEMYNNLKNTGHLGSIQAFAKSGRFDNDPKTWGQIMSMPTTTLAEMTTDQFYVKYRGKLDDAHLEQGMAMVANARGEAGGAKNPNTVEIVTVNERITRAAKDAKIIPFTGAKNEKQQVELGLFEDEVQKRVNAFSATLAKGKKPSGEEIQKIIDGVLMDKVKIDEFGRDPEKPLFLVQGKPDVLKNAYITVPDGRDIYISKISAIDTEKYTKKLRDAGIPVTQRKIAEMWAADNPRK